MTLQDKLDEFRSKFENGQLPFKATPEQFDVMKRATKELIDSGLAKRALKVGDTAPDFALKDADGNVVRLEELLARGPLVLSFYRGVWCPYCNIELQALEAARNDIVERGAQLVAVSPQTASNSKKSQRDNKLGFPILSDPRSELAATFGIRFQMPDDLIELYKSFGNNLPLVNDDPSWRLPMPARYVIGINRVIAYAEVSPDYTRRPDPSVLLPVLERLREERGR